jgi:hypothetical protein
LRKMNMQSERIILGDPGDLAAPVGSHPWAVAVKLRLEALLHEVDSEWQSIERCVTQLKETAAYQQFKNELGCPFQTFEEFCQASLPYGLGRPVEKLDKELEIRKLRQHGGDHTSQKFRKGEQPYHDKVAPWYGTNRSYLLARLERDRPDILEAFQRGEYRSVKAAAIHAGFVKDRARVEIPIDDPVKAAEILKRKLTQANLELLIAALKL